MTIPADIQIDVHLAEAGTDAILAELRQGLLGPVRSLPSRYFYDDHGSRLFEAITELPEYYPTRAEATLLRTEAAKIVGISGARELVELGSGAATKSRILLDAMRDADSLRRYVPVDVSDGILRRTALELRREYPKLEIHGMVADFMHHLDALPDTDETRLVAFLGGTIGNLEPEHDAPALLREVHDAMALGDRFLLGTDLIKDPAVIEAAYNDSQGITAAFNLNILKVVNERFDANFDVDAFRHRAFFDREHRWIEMRVVASRAMQVHIGALDMTIELDADEEIRTEISTKYDRERLEGLFAKSAFELTELYTGEGLFALSLARPT